MDLDRQTKALCSKYNIRPSRSKGQNFLIAESVYCKIIEAADLRPGDNVLEVGPGLGFLTKKLAERARQVVTVELDDKLANALGEILKKEKIKNVSIINENILDLDKINFSKGFQENFKVVANLPYNITSIFLRKILSADNKPESLVLLLQKEVAERIIAKPPKMGLLSVAVQFFSEPEITDYVNKENFWPEPKVDSAIIKLKVKNEKLDVSEKIFFRLVKIGFSAKRKMLKNNLAAGFKISGSEVEEKITAAGFDRKIRPGELSVKNWVRLLECFKKY